MGCVFRLQNSPYFCVFKYAQAVKQKAWNEAENRERDWGETVFFLSRACEAPALRARKTLTPRFTDFFTDFEKKNGGCFAVFCVLSVSTQIVSSLLRIWVRVLNDRVDSL